MRSNVLWRIALAVVIGAAIAASACSRPPGEPSLGLNWDEGAWDSYTWK